MQLWSDENGLDIFDFRWCFRNPEFPSTVFCKCRVFKTVAGAQEFFRTERRLLMDELST